AMDLLTFAAQRDADLVAATDEYTPQVEAALAEPDPADGHHMLLLALAAGFTAAYLHDGGEDSSLAAALAVFLGTMRSAVERTEPDETEAQVERIATWFATATLGAATLAAAESTAAPGDELVKTWVTMRDDKVRDTHAPLDGTFKKMNETFTVKSEPPAELLYPGEPVGPVSAWINCRCVLSVGVNALTASGSSGFSGVVLVALPAGDGTVTYADGDTTELHQTLAYLGTVDQLQPGEREELLAVGETIAAMTAPFTARVAGLATLGEDQDTVALTEAPELQDLHEMARTSEVVEAMYRSRNDHPTWVSHVTAQEYKAGDEIMFDRIGVWFGGDDHRTFALGGEPPIASSASDPGVVDETDDPPVPDTLLEPEDPNQPVYGVIAPEGVMSGDGRSFAPDGTTTRELPLPLSWVRSSTQEHDNSVIVGRVDTITRRDDGLLHWTGMLLGDVPETDEVILLIAEQALRGVSVDMDSAKITQQSEPDAAGNVDTEYAGRVSGLTIVAIPAFAEAFIALGLDPDLEPMAEPDMAADADTETFARGPGWLTNPEDTRRIHDYWTKGKGAAKIRWGTPGDFTRLRRHLAKYIEPRYLNRTVAQWHHDALGYWPGQCGMPGNPPCGKKRGKVPGVRGLASDTISTDSEETVMVASSHSHSIALVNPAPSITLVAAAPPAVVPAAWFADPKLDRPTPLTVTASGQVFGHIAKWGTCHIGIDKVCVTPPKSRQDYAYFHLGSVLTSDGEIAAGSLTLGTGHADLALSSGDTSRHYDHTGTQVAKVRAGEDDHGIWVAGTLCEGVTEAQVRTLMAAGGISGDWRSIGGNLELVAALAVNVPGFPVPRPALAASAGRQTALVAAGVVVATADPQIDAIAAAVVEKLTAAATRKARLDSLAPVQSESRARRVAALQDIS
ncbi:MAG: hypothetical protein MUP76_03250, partial [Acidimicrobiia bacterium]|nr:hypothetical protein [Acidimicrobiia bacterium]